MSCSNLTVVYDWKPLAESVDVIIIIAYSAQINIRIWSNARYI